MHAATYAAHVLNSAAGITAITTSPAPSGTYQQTNAIPTSQGYNNHRISPPTSRDRMDGNTHSSHNHTLASDNSPPLSASTTGSLKRRHTNEYPENSQQSPSLGGSSSGLPPGPGSQVLTQQPPLPPSSLPQQPGQQQQSFSHPQPPSQLQPGGVAASNLPLVQTEGQTCLGCNATSTPEWRRGPMGPRTLCNACGLVYAKLIKKRDRERARANGNGKNDGSSRPTSGEGHRSGSGGGDSGSGESDEDEPEDDYGSGTSGRRSEFG
ncbi:hypothetical protein DFH05DRAFT_1459535 [Lentinula detonsa]|uniref:GATA-type domain-containing protein n=1 Tax=Lentinula detonsa TaxID=2804962 RepID=A0A9W8P2S4_9AGAR|nr:hypothetical protein DFH05DRAFT_1459535 [Lentinula detonsa]